MLERVRYLVVEGPIGAGKTNLAQRLAAHCGFSTLLEEPDENPFLPKFYQDRARYALPTQLSFLLQRARQMESLAQRDLFRENVIADFMMDKDPLFARLTLSAHELRLYEAVFKQLAPPVLTPDLVIYLTASPRTLLERVRGRGSPEEKNITEDYLALVAEGYSRFFHGYDAAPVLMVKSDNLNLVEEGVDFELLLSRIEAMRGTREFFNRG